LESRLLPAETPNGTAAAKIPERLADPMKGESHHRDNGQDHATPIQFAGSFFRGQARAEVPKSRAETASVCGKLNRNPGAADNDVSSDIAEAVRNGEKIKAIKR
jgi:hypothetical protein